MNFLTFGRRSGLRVSELAFGTGNFGTGWGHGAERDEARAMFDGYLDAGGNFLDTADTYQAGQSEVLLGEFIKGQRDDLVVATKYTMGALPGGGAGVSATGNSRKNMMRSVDASLTRLGTDYIDLLWTHLPDGVTPMEEILRGFDDLVRSGKILYAGLSNFPAWRVARADLLAELRGWAPLAGIQIEYSLAERTPDRELLPMAEALGLGVATWSPLGGGFLTGKYRNQDANADARLTKLGMLVHTETNARHTALLDAVTSVAAQVDAPATHVAIAWLLARARRSTTGIVPILGSRTRAQFDATIGALALKLDDTQLRQLDDASAIPLGVPHDQAASSTASLNGRKTVAPRVVPVV